MMEFFPDERYSDKIVVREKFLEKGELADGVSQRCDAPESQKWSRISYVF